MKAGQKHHLQALASIDRASAPAPAPAPASAPAFRHAHTLQAHCFRPLSSYGVDTMDGAAGAAQGYSDAHPRILLMGLRR